MGNQSIKVTAYYINWLSKASSQDKARIYCLDCEGRIHVLCTLTYSVIKTYSEVNVVDLVLLEEEGEREFQFLLTVQVQINQQNKIKTGIS